jgi:protein-S-isoprenylcysteine O-methyltransferase Ste14
LTWGIFFKNINLTLFIISAISTICLLLTSLVEEKEDMKYFGKTYLDYMKRTKMFVPFVL